MTKRWLYFGHPLNIYDTPLETELLEKISIFFFNGGWDIVNPNGPEHQLGYQEYQKTHVDADGKPTGMGYFFEKILPACQSGVFLPFSDGMFGKGVFGEAEWLWKRGFVIWEINALGDISPILRLDASRCLTRDQTRERIRYPDGSSKPY